MPEGEPVYAIYILLQTKLDFHICPHLKYEGVKELEACGREELRMVGGNFRLFYIPIYF